METKKVENSLSLNDANSLRDIMNRRVFKYFLMIAIALYTSAAVAFEKVGTTSFQFLKIGMSARATGMAEAFAAVVDNSESVFYNPAGLVNVQSLDFTAAYMDYFLDVSHLALTAAYTIDGIGTFGFQGTMTDVGEIKVTSVDALGFVNNIYLGYTGESIKPGAQVFGVSFARRLTESFSFGVSAKYAREDLVVKATDNFMFDLGLSYETGFKSLKIAAVVRHFGPEVKYFDKEQLQRYDAANDSIFYEEYSGKSYPLPQTFDIAFSAYLMGPGESLFMQAENQTLMVAFDMLQPRDYDQQYNLGFEYGFEEVLFLRGGYHFNYDEESYTLGVGLKYSKYRIDYSYNDFGDYLDSVHRFTVGFNLD